MLDPRPTDPLTGRQLMAAVLVCLGVTFLLLALSGCSDNPIGEDCAPCGTWSSAPSADQITAEIRRGYDWAVETCPDLRPFGNIPGPNVELRLCNFTATNPKPVPDAPWIKPGACVHGMTLADEGKLVISLGTPSNTLATIRHEARNWYWLHGPPYCAGQAF